MYDMTVELTMGNLFAVTIRHPLSFTQTTTPSHLKTTHCHFTHFLFLGRISKIIDIMATFTTFVFLALFGLATKLVSAQAPTLNYPIQGQLPPVARVSQYFEWSLLPDTFASSSSSSLTYAALDMPDWLSFDANTLTFHGSPRNADTGNNFVIVQANATGAAQGTQSGFHCLVVDQRGPTVQAPIAQQLTDGEAVISSAYLQSDGSVRIPPSWSFSIGFQYYTFSDGDRKIYYTAYRAGTTYLPDWLEFDNETVTFGGLAPSNTNYFEIDLYGSDHYGYGDVKQTFTVVVGTHSFVLQGPLPPINATAKDTVEYTIPISGLMLDAQRISSTNLTSVVAVIPSNASYLTYNPSSRTITGTLPAELPSTDDLYIPVTFTSIFNDTIVTNVTLSITPQLFSQSNLPSINITGGQYFSESLATYLTNTQASYSAAFDPANASDWLNFDNSSKILAGTPPMNGKDIRVNITAADASSNVVESATLTLLFNDAQAQLQKKGGGGLSNGAKIALAVVFGILGGLLLLVLIMWLCRRYCHHEDNVDDDATLAAASEKGKYRQTPLSTGRASMGGSTDSDRLSQAINAAEISIANAMAREQSKPKRIDLMNVFGGIKKSSSSRDMPTTQSGRSMKEILGLAPGMRNIAPSPDVRQHQIITVTDGDGYTYRPTTPTGPPALLVRNASMSDEEAGSVHGSDRTSSSFDSRQSSSLFYSEEGGSNESPVQRPAAAHTREGTPRSIPRRRRDFLPYRPPPRKSSAGDGMSNDAITPPVQGIRIVPQRRPSDASSLADVSYNAQVNALDYNAALAADAAIATAHLEQLNEPGTAASVHSFGSRPHSTPRLIAFTSEKRGERASSPPEKRFSSQRGIHSESGHVSQEHSRADAIDESTEDSPFEDNYQRYSTVSQPYHPPDLDGASPIYFSTSPSGREANQQTPSPDSVRSIPRTTRSRANTNSMFVEPFRIQLNAGDPFHFTAQIHPPPMATIGSPGRDGSVIACCRPMRV